MSGAVGGAVAMALQMMEADRRRQARDREKDYMRLLENDREIARPRTVDEAKRIIAGCDESMAAVDCDPQGYKLLDNDGKIVYERPKIRIP